MRPARFMQIKQPFAMRGFVRGAIKSYLKHLKYAVRCAIMRLWVRYASKHMQNSI